MTQTVFANYNIKHLAENGICSTCFKYNGQLKQLYTSQKWWNIDMTEGCTGQFNPDTTAIVNMRGRPKSTQLWYGVKQLHHPCHWSGSSRCFTIDTWRYAVLVVEVISIYLTHECGKFNDSIFIEHIFGHPWSLFRISWVMFILATSGIPLNL